MNQEWLIKRGFNFKIHNSVYKNNEICFTEEYLKLTEELGSEARGFASLLMTHWDPELKTLLDYFGDPDAEEDEYSGIDGTPMNVKEDVTDLWEYYDKAA